MPVAGRLADLETNLRLLYEKLAAMEKSRAMAVDPEIKISALQRIREEIKPQIRECEAEYWQLLSQEITSWAIDEADANHAISEVIQTVQIIKETKASQYPDEVIQRLAAIQNKLNEPAKTSSAKLKAVVPLIPPLVSIEMEIETKDIVQRLFPTFSRLLKKVEKK